MEQVTVDQVVQETLIEKQIVENLLGNSVTR